MEANEAGINSMDVAYIPINNEDKGEDTINNIDCESEMNNYEDATHDYPQERTTGVGSLFEIIFFSPQNRQSGMVHIGGKIKWGLAVHTISWTLYSITFRVPVTIGIRNFLYSVFINWLGLGAIIATLTKEIANRYLLETNSSSFRQSVEWLHAFDIHCNAFFPIFVFLYGIQILLLPIVLSKSLIGLAISNTIYVVAFACYWYITYLRYRALSFLSRTEVFRYPIAGIILFYVINLVLYPFGRGWNASRVMAHIYFD